MGRRQPKQFLPESCIPTAAILKAVKLHCHILLAPESHDTFVPEDPANLSEHARFRLAILALNHLKVPLRSDVEDAYKAIIKARVSVMSVIPTLKKHILNKCQKQVCSLFQLIT